MQTLRQQLEAAREKKTAVGHFNVSDSNQLKAVANTAWEMGQPVIIGVSEGERAWLGLAQIAALVKSYRDTGQDIYLNADHTKTIGGIEAAIAAGFDAVLFDGSALPMEENIAKTREAVALARAAGREVVVEGELGYIGSGSTLLDKIPEGAGLQKTDPEVAGRFVRETGIDMLAPSIGNIHGMLTNAPEPRLDTELVGKINASCGIPLVLHGASGNTSDDIAACIKGGVSVVHINTEIRLAYRKGIEEGLAKAPGEVTPSKYLNAGVDAVAVVVKEKLALYTRG